MGKRKGRRKSARQDRVFRRGSIEVRQSGTSVILRNIADKNDFEATRAQRLAVFQEAVEDFRRETVNIEARLSKYDPLTILGYLILREGVINPETYKEYEYSGASIKIEHTAMLCAKHVYSDNGSLRLEAEDLRALTEYLDSIPTLLPFMYDPDHSFSEAQMRVLLWSATVRMPAYEYQYVRVLRELFAPMERRCLATIGFSVSDAIAIEQAYTTHVNMRLAAILGRGRKESRAMLEVANGADPPAGFSAELAARLRMFPREDRKAAVMVMFQLWAAAAIGHALALRPAELSELTGVPIERVTAALDHLSVRFGEVSSSYVLPEPYGQLQSRPLLNIGERYLCPSVPLFLPAIQPALEHALNPARSETGSQTEFNRYNDHRKQYSEQKALDYIARVLPGCAGYLNLKFSFEGRGWELDGLILFDRTLMLVEAKAGAFSRQARAGNSDAIVGDIDKLVNDAHEQALRALRYIASTDRPMFRVGAGDKIVIDKSTVDRTLLITVTLEQLGNITADLNALPGLHKNTQLPWALSLWDLEVITELVESPAEFIDYVVRRSALLERGGHHIGGADELDWFGRYQHDSLEFANIQDVGKDARVMLSSHSTEIDSYVYAAQGMRSTPAAKPKHRLEPCLRLLVDAMERSGVIGWSEIAVALMSMRHKLIRAFCKRLRKTLRRDEKRWFTIEPRGGLSIACSVHPEPPPIVEAAQSLTLAVSEEGAPLYAVLVRGDRPSLTIAF